MEQRSHRSDVSLPKYSELRWPALEALRELGGSGTIEEIDVRAIRVGGFSEEQQRVLHGNGPQTELEYRLAWARTWLKIAGAVGRSGRAIWSLTEKGWQMSPAELEEAVRQQVALRRTERRQQRGAHGVNGSSPVPPEAELDEVEIDETEQDWKGELLDVLLAMRPDKFERLAQRLLREEGFISVEVTGRSGDEGIDGVGLYRMSLVTFPVFFQCKRYRGTVPPRAVRELRGAMQGRGERGLLITTGTFTADAKHEATRTAPTIDLIDGDYLCELLLKRQLGVAIRTVVDIAPDFFETI